jgi:DNA repair protein RecO (recombination protein O)
VNGIIIAENNSNDYDKMLTMLTPNLGKISCSAKGAKRAKSQLLGATQLFTFGEYMLFKGSDTYTINSCETIEMFYNIRTDLDTLYAISETNKNLDFIVSVFKMRLMKILGFAPNVEECVLCKSKENLNSFSFKDNGFKCEECSKQEAGAFGISQATKNAIIYSTKADAKKIFSFNLSENSLKEFEIVSRLYLNEKLEKEYNVDKLF